MDNAEIFREEKTHDKMNAVREMIYGVMALRNMSVNDLAEKLDMSPTTLRYHIRHPECIRIRELFNIMDILMPDDYYIKKIFLT